MCKFVLCSLFFSWYLVLIKGMVARSILTNHLLLGAEIGNNEKCVRGDISAYPTRLRPLVHDPSCYHFVSASATSGKSYNDQQKLTAIVRLPGSFTPKYPRLSSFP